MSKVIEEGDFVRVRFHNADLLLCEKAKVLHKPIASGDSWVFEDIITPGIIHHVTEGCTITLIGRKKEEEDG